MARDGRSDSRDERQAPPADRSAERGHAVRSFEVPMSGLRLPKTDAREAVTARERVYHLRESETRALAVIGTFRVVPEAELTHGSGASTRADLRSLAEQGLIARTMAVVNHEPTPLVVLTDEGKTLLDGYSDAGGARQQYHAGLVKPRELGHDVQLYRLYQMEAARLEHDGGRIARIVLDYELKHDYQTFLNRKDRPEGTTQDRDLMAFADARHLPIIEGHLELPDLRIEYETEDGRVAHRDVELVTEHYSRGHLAGKAQAGFALYRVAGAGGVHGGSTRTGGTPLDPHHLEALLWRLMTGSTRWRPWALRRGRPASSRWPRSTAATVCDGST